jgi:hypothetical protein
VSERKVDPTGKRALYSMPPTEAPDRSDEGRHNEGKDALFSMTPPRLGTVVVECSSCQVRKRVSLIEAWGRLAMLTVWYPFRRHPHWMNCPSCGRRGWCRIGWMD